MDHAISGPDPALIPGEADPLIDGQGPPSAIAAGSRLERLPPEIGALLLVVGIAGLLLPGPVGSPFVVAGGVALWPAAFGRVDGWFRRKFPNAHRTGMEQMERYLSDLERRYPGCLDVHGPGPS